MNDKNNTNKNTSRFEEEIAPMSVVQCENALNELMAELEGLGDTEPQLTVDEGLASDVGSASKNAESDFKELDGKKAEGDAVFAFTLTDLPDGNEQESDNEIIDSVEDMYDVDLFCAAARLVVEEGVTSVSFLQRSLGIGYEKASEIVDRLEKLAIISPMDGNRPRKVLVSAEKLEKILSEQ